LAVVDLAEKATSSLGFSIEEPGAMVLFVLNRFRAEVELT
jgi:hypothetical protein